MTLVRKAHFQCDLAYRELSFSKQQCCTLYAPTNHVLMHRHSCRLAERDFQMRDAHSDHICDSLERETAGYIFFNIRLNLTQPVVTYNRGPYP